MRWFLGIRFWYNMSEQEDDDRMKGGREHNRAGCGQGQRQGEATRQMPMALPHLWVFFSSNITLVDREWTQSCSSLLQIRMIRAYLWFP
jgi:hypothetical protein